MLPPPLPSQTHITVQKWVVQAYYQWSIAIQSQFETLQRLRGFEQPKREKSKVTFHNDKHHRLKTASTASIRWNVH
jgi:hypothetical protein